MSAEAAAWVYRGVWAALTGWFLVPREPPALPATGGEPPVAFQPSPRFLDYLKLWFWIPAVLFDLALLAAWIAVTAIDWRWGLGLALPALAIGVVPDVILYVALHLRYDTTWYVMTDRSLRIRRGIWIIHEVSITFENVQNVRVQQGPVQRLFNIASVIIETAGSGGGEKKSPGGVTNQGIIEGIENAGAIRDRITARVRASRSAGLGDEDDRDRGAAWSPEHVAVLREIRDALAAG